MAEKELTFLDLVVLDKMEKDTVLNTFGTTIDASFFETAQFMGTLQTKGFIEISSGIGRSVANRTQVGEGILARAKLRSDEPLDELDHAILKAVAAGAKDFTTIFSDLNIGSDALSYHLYRLAKQGYVEYTVKAAQASFNLTEDGFKLTGVVPKKTVQATLKQTSISQQMPVAKAGVKGGAPGKKEAGDILQEAFGSSEDATSGMAPKVGKVELSGSQKSFGKIAFYLRKYSIAIVIIVIIIALIFAASQGYIKCCGLK